MKARDRSKDQKYAKLEKKKGRRETDETPLEMPTAP